MSLSVRAAAMVLALLASVAASADATTKAQTLSLLPDGVADKKIVAEGPAEHFPDKRLFDYMDGGAERYLGYGFTDIAVRRYARGADKVTLEIYRMGSPAEAFGIFAFFARGEAVDVGAPAALAHGALNAYKGRFLVRTVAASAAKPPKDLLVELARKALSRIDGKAEVPAGKDRLPAGAVTGSLRYLHKPEVARTVFFEGEGDVLLEDGGAGFSALYAAGDEELQLVRIAYPSAAAAGAACAALGKKLGIAAPAGASCAGAGQREDDTFSAFAVTGAALRWAGNAPDLKTARAWLAKID